MAAQMSPLRRWKRFFGAFDSVDAAIEAADPHDPDLCRDWLRRARGDIFEGLCNTADDAKAEQLCGILDGLMAESLETLRLTPVTPTVLATTDLAKAVRALQKHESERVRVLAKGIVSGWRASALELDEFAGEALHQPDNFHVPQLKDTVDQKQVHKTTERPSSNKIVDHDSAVPDAKKKTVETSNKASDLVVSISTAKPKEVTVGRHAIVSADPDAKAMEAAKRKLHERYQQASDAKRQRRVQLVVAPEMLKQRPERSLQAGCASSMLRKTFSVSRHQAGSQGLAG